VGSLLSASRHAPHNPRALAQRDAALAQRQCRRGSAQRPPPVSERDEETGEMHRELRRPNNDGTRGDPIAA